MQFQTLTLCNFSDDTWCFCLIKCSWDIWNRHREASVSGLKASLRTWSLFDFYSKHFTYKIFFSFEIGSHSIAQVSLDLIAILLPWPLVCWNHMNELAYVFTYVVVSEFLYFSKSPFVICKMTQGKNLYIVNYTYQPTLIVTLPFLLQSQGIYSSTPQWKTGTQSTYCINRKQLRLSWTVIVVRMVVSCIVKIRSNSSPSTAKMS